jgi:hypothetical protein
MKVNKSINNNHYYYYYYHDIIYSESGDVSFKTYHFSPYCLLQDRHVHMPIQSWRLTPREATNSCMFYIESSSFEMNIEIRVSNAFKIY